MNPTGVAMTDNHTNPPGKPGYSSMKVETFQVNAILGSAFAMQRDLISILVAGLDEQELEYIEITGWDENGTKKTLYDLHKLTVGQANRILRAVNKLRYIEENRKTLRASISLTGKP
jgi:hypothetical protein